MLEKINQGKLNYQINGSKSIFDENSSSSSKDNFKNVKESARQESAKINIAALKNDILKSREQTGFNQVTHDFGDYDRKSFLA